MMIIDSNAVWLAAYYFRQHLVARQFFPALLLSELAIGERVANRQRLGLRDWLDIARDIEVPVLRAISSSATSLAAPGTSW